VVLSEDVSQNRIVAQYQLPFTFQFVADFPVQCAGPPLAGFKRNRRHMEDELDERPPAIDQRNVRPRLNEPSQRDTDGERINHPIPTVNPWGITTSGQNRDSRPPSPSSRSILFPRPLQAVTTNPQGTFWLCSMVIELMGIHRRSCSDRIRREWFQFRTLLFCSNRPANIERIHQELRGIRSCGIHGEWFDRPGPPFREYTGPSGQASRIYTWASPGVRILSGLFTYTHNGLTKLPAVTLPLYCPQALGCQVPGWVNRSI
jgi:hypothetical protein